jgi:hypothetical protein
MRKAGAFEKPNSAFSTHDFFEARTDRTVEDATFQLPQPDSLLRNSSEQLQHYFGFLPGFATIA